MAVSLNPYLNFRGQARAAMEFYQSVLGGELTVTTFAEFGISDDPAEKDNLMHAQLRTPLGMTLMGADVPAQMDFAPGNTFYVSLSGDDATELTRYWEGLSESAKIDEPLTAAPWGDSFGMLTDRFGVQWMVNIAGTEAAT